MCISVVHQQVPQLAIYIQCLTELQNHDFLNRQKIESLLHFLNVIVKKSSVRDAQWKQDLVLI